jgi:four helix bundle protein
MGLQQSLRRNAGNAQLAAGSLAHTHAPAHDRKMKTYFDHEKLDVYQHSLKFCSFVGDVLDEITSKAAAKDQLDRASTSIPLNIAEGNGKFSHADRARFLEIARGSAVECAACLDVLASRKLIDVDTVIAGKEELLPIVNMLMGLLKRFSDRAEVLREDSASYESEQEQEREKND